jgi:hypothetical protein
MSGKYRAAGGKQKAGDNPGKKIQKFSIVRMQGGGGFRGPGYN